MANGIPLYPVYIPSKGRWEEAKTARLLRDEGVPFRLVVEPQERDHYAAEFGDDAVLTIDHDNAGSSIPSRNFCKAHSTAEGHLRHWQLDDNLRKFNRYYAGRRKRCPAGVALRVAEDFTDRYENIAISGLNCQTFIVNARDGKPEPPFRVNERVYSCTLVFNALPYEWRGPYNEDTDLCLQVLAGGWCTVLFNAVHMDKQPTMTMAGGNSDTLYQGDGRLKMARCLERRWPGVVTTGRRWGRPQHVVNWRKFTTPLKRRADVDFDALAKAGPNEYGMVLRKVK